jgi:hypothetical protein
LLEHASIADAAPTGELHILSVTHKDALAARRARPDCHRFLCGPLSALMTFRLRVAVTGDSVDELQPTGLGRVRRALRLPAPNGECHLTGPAVPEDEPLAIQESPDVLTKSRQLAFNRHRHVVQTNR